MTHCDPDFWGVFTTMLAASLGMLPVLALMFGFITWRTWRDNQRLERHRREDRERWERDHRGWE
jgi:hypothetical protein